MKILLVQTSFLGDNILSTPVVSGIRSLYPTCDLHVLTTALAAPVYKGNPNIQKVLVFDKRGEHSGLMGIFRFARQLKEARYDIVYSLHRSARTSLLLYFADIPKRIGFKQASLSFLYSSRRERPTDVHEVMRNLALLEPDVSGESVDTALHLPVHQSGTEVLAEFLEQVPDSYAVLVPGSVWATKRWSASEFRKTAEQLLAEGTSVVLLGAPSEVDIARQVGSDLDVIDLCGKTSLDQMFSLVKDASVIVCNDSMSLHVASTFKVPTVVVFCATSPSFGFGPWQNETARVVEREDLDCKPCRRHGSNKCPLGTNACMDGVSAERVRDAIAEVTA